MVLHGGCHTWFRNHYDLNTLVFVQRINACFIFDFSILTMLKITCNFRKFEVAFFLDVSVGNHVFLC